MAGPTQEQVFLVYGVALLTVQQTEKVLKLILANIIPRGSSRASRRLFSDERAVFQRTLGQCLTELRTRVHVEPGFDGTLREFLEMRNTFAHSAEAIAGWDMQTEEGRKIAHEFAATLANTASRVAKVLLALGLLSDNDLRRQLGGQPFFESLEKDVSPFARATFSPRKR
jgi:hypothetical protein